MRQTASPKRRVRRGLILFLQPGEDYQLRFDPYLDVSDQTPRQCSELGAARYRKPTLDADLIDEKEPKTLYQQLHALYDTELKALSASAQPQTRGRQTKRGMRSPDAPFEHSTLETRL